MIKNFQMRGIACDFETGVKVKELWEVPFDAAKAVTWSESLDSEPSTAVEIAL